MIRYPRTPRRSWLIGVAVMIAVSIAVTWWLRLSDPILSGK